MATKKKSQASSKTDALSIRIDPRLRYGLELLSRVQRRSVTGVVEWAIENALRTEQVDPLSEYSSTFAQAVTSTWSPNEPERLQNLAKNYPDLMTYEESRLWRVLAETEPLRAGTGSRSTLLMSVVNQQWEKLKPLLQEAAERPVLVGLTEEALKAGGVDPDPFPDIPF